MGETITLTSRFDGFALPAYHAAPRDARRGGLVLVQEIFGVTDHIRELCEGFAEDGYEVIAPAFFERLEPGFAADYSPDSIKRGVQLSQATPWDQVQGDLQAAIDALDPPVFVTGFCWGGAATWLAACRCEGLAAAAAYYGRRISELVEETPKVPIILHYGKTDASIPLDQVEAVREQHPEIPVHLYEAGHGFVSDRRSDYHEDSARLARLRTLAHFSRHSGVRAEA
jgi:carboxymethylenebutenolidase